MIINRSAANPADVRIALAASGTPNNEEYIEYDVSVPPKGVLERTGMALQASKSVIVYTSTADTSVTVTGLEQVI